MNIRFTVLAAAATMAATPLFARPAAPPASQQYQRPPQQPTRAPAPRLRFTGTFQLDAQRGDDARRMVDTAARSLSPRDRDAVTANLTGRLQPPDTIAIDRSEGTVTIASSRGPRVTFQADGAPQTEHWRNGTVTTRATIVGDQLQVQTTSGDRGSDFRVTFEPIDQGNGMLVTRTIDNDSLSGPVTVRSFYRKTSDQPRWDLVTRASSRGNGPAMLVPEGTVLTGTLNNAIGTRASREGDRFSVTIHGSQFNGAVLDGIVRRINGPNRPGNRPDMLLDFDTIHLRGGRTAEFDGTLDRVRTPDGAAIGVGNEGGVRNGAQSDDALQRGAIGAAVGALIGAIAGGGKGAGIGAAVGAAGGAGSVYIEGRTDLDLPAGTEMTIRVTTPRR